MKARQTIFRTIIMVLLVLTRVIPAGMLYAEDPVISPVPESTETSTTESTDSSTDSSVSTDNQTGQTAEITTDTETTSNTGDNAIGPTPTPTPTTGTEPDTYCESDCPEETTITEDEPVDTGSANTATQSARTESSVTASAVTGNNTSESTDDAPPESGAETFEDADGEGAIITSDSVAITDLQNEVNTIEQNAEVYYHTINIFVDQNTTLDFSDPVGFITGILEEHETDPVINVSVSSVDQRAIVTNTVDTSSNTGGNSITGTEDAQVSTGDAYTILSLLNRVNFVVIDSIVHIVVINIFGDLTGNIILPSPPEDSATESCDSCVLPEEINQDAAITNTATVSATTGNNTLVTEDGGDITTGSAINIVSISDFVNTVIIGGQWFYLLINPYGEWNGDFLGWGKVEGAEGGQQVTVTDQSSQPGSDENGLCDTCIDLEALSSSAVVTNNIHATANTGSNIVSSEDGSIETGNAYNIVSILNFINTAFVNSFGFFGIINIFGTFNGNIGDALAFTRQYQTSTDPDPVGGADIIIEQVSEETAGEQKELEEGGALAVTNANNVGAYVFPGDTVTFFLTGRNTGNGTVYNAVLDLDLIYDGEFVGGAQYILGDLDVGKGKKITTGLSLAPNIPAGIYTARATVRGVVGPDNNVISAYADSTFTVFSTQPTALGSTTQTDVEPVPAYPSVRGATHEKGVEPNILKALLVLFLLIPMYWSMRVWEGRQYLKIIFHQQLAIGSRLRAIRLLLL